MSAAAEWSVGLCDYAGGAETWWWPSLQVDSNCQTINLRKRVICVRLKISIYIWGLHQRGCFIWIQAECSYNLQQSVGSSCFCFMFNSQFAFPFWFNLVVFFSYKYQVNFWPAEGLTACQKELLSMQTTKVSWYASSPLCWFNNKEFLCITRTVKHNYILPISTVRIQLHVSVLYVDHLQVEIF